MDVLHNKRKTCLTSGQPHLYTMPQISSSINSHDMGLLTLFCLISAIIVIASTATRLQHRLLLSPFTFDATRAVDVPHWGDKRMVLRRWWTGLFLSSGFKQPPICPIVVSFWIPSLTKLFGVQQLVLQFVSASLSESTKKLGLAAYSEWSKSALEKMPMTQKVTRRSTDTRLD